MSQETERKEKGIPAALVIEDSSRWALALCALASKKVVRGAILIADSYGIFETLHKLEEQGIVELDIKRYLMPGKGWRVVDFDDWAYQLNKYLGGYAREDKYEEGRLNIDNKTEAYFLQAIAEELSFAGEEKRAQIFGMAKTLGASELLENLEKKIEEYIEKVCASDMNKPFLSVLIPLACIQHRQAEKFYLPGIGREITMHRNQCHYCRNFLRENGLLESAV